jgi:hypothetical protein
MSTPFLNYGIKFFCLQSEGIFFRTALLTAFRNACGWSLFPYVFSFCHQTVMLPTHTGFFSPCLEKTATLKLIGIAGSFIYQVVTVR